MVFHHGDMSSPAKPSFEEHCLDAGNPSHFKDVDVDDEVNAMDIYCVTSI